MKILNKILFSGCQALRANEKIPLMYQWEIDDVPELGISSSRGEMLMLKNVGRLVKTGIFRIPDNDFNIFDHVLKSISASNKAMPIDEALGKFAKIDIKPYWLIGNSKAIKSKYKKQIKKNDLKVLSHKSDQVVLAPAKDLGIFITMFNLKEVIDAKTDKMHEIPDNTNVYGTYIIKNPSSRLITIK